MQAVQVYDRIFDFDGATGCAEIQQKMRSGKMSNPAKMTLNRPKKMQVSIKKTGGLGVKLDFKGTSEGAVVNQIMSEGHIATWNSENPSQVIEIGDRIVSLNDKLLKGTKLMEELKASTELKMMEESCECLASESNIPVLTEVAKCMGLVAKGLQKQFERFARQLLPVALARINDKSVWKPHCLIERVEQLLWSVPLDVLLEELPVHISSKSLFVKKEALHLLMRALELPQVLAMYPDAPQHFFHSSANLMMPLVDDSDNTVRQEAVKALAKLVLQNREAADTVLDRLPAHRRNLFEDEYRKLCKETPATPEPRVPTPLSPVITDRRTSPLKQLHTVTVESAPLQPLPSPGMKAQNADLKADKEEIVGDGRSKDGKAAKAEGKENRSDTVKEANPSETPLIKQMAEEIRNLRSKVKQLELDKERHEKVEPKAVDTPSPGPTVEAMNRLRAPASNRRAESAERVSAQPGRDATPTRRAPRELGTPTRRQPLQRSGSDFAPRPRDATPPRREATLRPATPPRRHEAPGPTLAPREATPTRREHSMRREPTPTRRREPTPTRREPTPTRREPMALRREPTPTRRDPSVSREATPRNDSTPSRHQELRYRCRREVVCGQPYFGSAICIQLFVFLT
eukprot:symbB.v1.2.000489.t1/scaffold11.1/size528188/38